MTTRKYSSRSQQTTLTSAVTSTGSSITVVSGSAVMGGIGVTGGETFTIVIDPDTALEEICDVIAVSTNTLTLATPRGIDGSLGQAHSAGAVVRHMAIGRDYRDANIHQEASTAVHGLTSGVAVVGDTATQTLTNKTINAASNTISGITSAMITDGTLVNADINASAAIAYSKLALTGAIVSNDIANDTIVNADINTAAAIAATKIAGTAVTLADTGTITSTMILDGTIVNGDIAAGAAIARTKIANPTADVSNGGFKITSLATPTDTADASTKGYVDTAISNLIGGAPSTLDTLDEIAAALNDTANFADTVVLKTGSTMSGALAMGTNKITGLGNPTNAQDAVTKFYLDNTVLAPSNLTGPITSVGNVTSIASQTGTGTKFVVDTSPTLVTPELGAATATSINGTVIPASKTLVATDSTTYVVPPQASNSGKFLTTNGTVSSWSAVNSATPTVAGAVFGKTDDATPFSTKLGYQSLNVSTGLDNTAVGYNALLSNTTGYNNTAVGSKSLDANTNGIYNTAVGNSALTTNINGDENVAVGHEALKFNTAGYGNTAVGSESLTQNTTGDGNTAIGNFSLDANTTGNNNTALGYNSLGYASTGSQNTAVGSQSMPNLESGIINTAVGNYALNRNATGSYNTAVGGSAGNWATGADNTFIGNDSGTAPSPTFLTGSNNTYIGNKSPATSLSVSNEVVIGNSSIDTFKIPGLALQVNRSTAYFDAAITEKATVSATAATGTINYGVITNKSVTYYTTAATGNWTFNVRGDGTTTLNSILDTGKSLTVVFINTNTGTAYYPTGFQIDGTTVTPKWQGGTAPTSGNANSVDIYTYAIIKTASATYSVFASQTKFA